jgi:hypothetical protein
MKHSLRPSSENKWKSHSWLASVGVGHSEESFRTAGDYSQNIRWSQAALRNYKDPVVCPLTIRV